MPMSPEERAALHRRYLHDHLMFLTADTARWMTEADIRAQAIAEVMRENEATQPETYTRPTKVK